MTRPTAATLALARSTLPTRRLAPGVTLLDRNRFASLLQAASAARGHEGEFKLVSPQRPQLASPVASSPQLTAASGPPTIARAEILATAQQLLDVPYVWGGTSPSGLDCSAFVSRAWGVPRQTTDTLASVARPITKDELQSGDALNLTTTADPSGYGHVRIFDRWANAEHTQMWVYEDGKRQKIETFIAPSKLPLNIAVLMDTSVLTGASVIGGFVRQCAWCWLVVDGSGQYRIRAARKLISATHGICPYCKEAVRAEIEGRARGAQPVDAVAA